MNARAQVPAHAEDRIEALIAAFDRMDGRLEREHKENRGDISELKEEILRAFPGNDPEGHRRYHEQLIEQSAARTKFWRELTSRLLQQGIWAVATGVFLAAGWALVQWIRSVK